MSEQIELAGAAPVGKKLQQDRMEDRFDPFMVVLQKQVNTILALFPIPSAGAVVGNAANVTGDELYEIYLNSFEDPEVRQDHTCRCCKHFFRSYANLIQVTADGGSHSVLFQDSDDVPELYRPFVRAASEKLRNARVGLLLTAPRKGAKVVIGEATKGGFKHLSFELEGLLVRDNSLHTTYQAGAFLRESAELLNESFGRWTLPTLQRGKALFSNDARLAKSTHADIIADYVDIREFQSSIKHHNVRSNYVTVMAASNRPGLVRIAQKVVGEFLDKLQGLRDENYAIQHFLAMTAGENYMRATVAPSAMAVARAEKIFNDLELAPSVERRALRRDELTTFLWRRPEAEAASVPGGLFGAVKTKEGTASGEKSYGEPIQAGKVSVAKLIKLIRAGVEGIDVMIPGGQSKIFSSLTTAVHADAKPILRWDDEDNRNPICGYAYTNPVYPTTWGLHPYNWEPVLGLVPHYEEMNRPVSELTEQQIHEARFVLVNGHDNHPQVNLPLFSSTLRPELHEVRSVIEAFCKTTFLQEVDQGLVQIQPMIGLKFRLTLDGAQTVYEIGSME